MYRCFGSSLIVSLALMVMAVAAQAGEPSSKSRIEALAPALVDVAPDEVFSPQGFDDNDNAQLVLDGTLPNSCYKLGPTHTRIDHAHRVIYVRQQAFYYPGAWCAEIRTPYVQTVNLGVLASGTYRILTEEEGGAPKLAGELPIAISASASADDFLYAPVEEARLEREARSFEHPADTRNQLVLFGHFNSTCMAFREVKLNLRANRVIEVLPIIDYDRESQCAQVRKEFTINVSLKHIPNGRYLIHVRSLNGQSLNRIVTF